MASASSPQQPLFRTTLFFGPEPVPGPSGLVRCVFNVKKRSWKSGIQVEVRLLEGAIDRARAALGYESWVEGLLAAVPSDERERYRQRAEELLAQRLCGLTLELALGGGLPQENQLLDGVHLAPQLEASISDRVGEIREWVQAELDLSE